MGSHSDSNDRLFQPLQVGAYNLSHRLVLAPLTRFRADDEHVPLPMVKDYYTQRASVAGTLLITEATLISPNAGSYANVPGIWNQAQIAAWKEVVDSVHSAGGFIFMQLWALGRTADAAFKEKEGTGGLVSSSAIPMGEGAPTPRALTDDEISEYIRDYAQAAKNAVEGAGFDGVELHGANGYLIDQFIQDVSNTRTDRWGGSIENRARFAIEATKAVVDAVGADKTGIRLSPFSTFQSMKMKDPIPQFTHVVKQLKELKLAYVHLVESRISGNADIEATELCDPLIEALEGTTPVLLAGGFKPDSAKQAVNQDYKDTNVAIVFGRLFIPNPDLVFRIKEDIELTPYDRTTFYKPKSPDGYIDWPFSAEWEKQNSRL